MEYHKPVLFDEVMDNIITDKDAVYVDCTLGGGGHTEGILENSSKNSKVVAIDQDVQAIEFAKKRLEKYANKLQIFQDNFRNIDTAVYLAGFEKVDRILMDIGVSSNQLDNAKRGFSYRFEARLDMRMDSNLKISAYEVINNFSEKLLITIDRIDFEEKINYLSRLFEFLISNKIDEILFFKCTKALENLYHKDIDKFKEKYDKDKEYSANDFTFECYKGAGFFEHKKTKNKNGEWQGISLGSYVVSDVGNIFLEIIN